MLLIYGCGGRRDDASSNPQRAVAPYVSNETGFRFTPPPAWEADRYLVSEVTGKDAAERQPGALSIAEIQYQPIEIAHRPEVLLRIHVFPDSAWNAMKREGGEALGGVVAHARGRTYLASTAQADPYPAATRDAATFDAMLLALADVKRWLSVADAASDLASEFLPGSPTFGPTPVMYLGTMQAGAGDASRRPVKVIFRADSSALFSTEYAGSRVENQRGHWSLEGIYVRLVLLGASGEPNGRLFIWAIRDSALAPVAWDRNAYGSTGLTLVLRP